MQKLSLFLTLALAGVALPASAAAISTGNPGPWYSIQATLNQNATGGPDGTPAYFAPGAAPWTFTLLSAGTLDFTDAQNSGDQYDVHNNGNLLTSSSGGVAFDPNTSCDFDPTVCFGSSNFSHVSGFVLAAGSYSLDFVLTSSAPQSSAAFFRINDTLETATPEPSTYVLSASAIGLLAWLKRRKA